MNDGHDEDNLRFHNEIQSGDINTETDSIWKEDGIQNPNSLTWKFKGKLYK